MIITQSVDQMNVIVVTAERRGFRLGHGVTGDFLQRGFVMFRVINALKEEINS